MSLFRDLIQSALAADLTKNEYKALLGLLHQTLGYGKATDNLTDNRLAQITGVRKDRLCKALDGVVACGLFSVKPHPYFDYCYTIGESFTKSHHTAFFTPSLPKNGRNSQKTEAISESRVHTDTNLYLFNPTPPPDSTESVALSNSESQLEPESVAIRNPSVKAEPESVALSNSESQLEPESVALGNYATMLEPKPESVAVNAIASDGGDIALPVEISASNRAACQKVLLPLSIEQRKLTLQVFGSMATAGKVRKPAGLLITLAKAAQRGTLIVPDSAVGFVSGADCKRGSMPLHPSHLSINPSDSNATACLIEQSADLAFMQMQSRLQGKPLEDIALLYGKADLLKEVQHV